MDEAPRPDPEDSRPPLRGPRRLPQFGERFGEIELRFEEHGAVGMLVLDVPALREIEREYGVEAKRRAFGALAAIAQRLADDMLDIDDLVLEGERGFDEILVLLFRSLGDGRFYTQELHAFALAFRREVARRGSKLLYPYRRQPTEIASGVACLVRNPKIGVETQMRSGLEASRADADLNVRLEARKRRDRILDIILDRKVTSVYEPIVEVKSKTVYGYEALARGPQGTDLQAPLALFALAEREDLVFELDCLCRESGLRGAEGFPEGTRLFLNIRPTTIHDPNFRAERLISTLRACELSPRDVVFEISEQESIRNFDAFKEVRDYYRGLGFRFALDDTGAGYAGLEALVEVSPDFIKVDRAFVSGIDHDPIRKEMLGALQRVSEKTSAQLIAEGLDTLEELETVGELGIAFWQGWLFGKPTPLRASD